MGGCVSVATACSSCYATNSAKAVKRVIQVILIGLYRYAKLRVDRLLTLREAVPICSWRFHAEECYVTVSGLGSVVWLWQYQELFPATTVNDGFQSGGPFGMADPNIGYFYTDGMPSSNPCQNYWRTGYIGSHCAFWICSSQSNWQVGTL